MRVSVWIHRILIMIGCGCLLAVAITLVRAASFQEAAGENLDRALLAEKSDTAATTITDVVTEGLIGRLEIPRLNMSVIVMEGDDDWTLARAAGHLPGTAFPWNVGNVVIAGHRDSFFRPLKDLRQGDELRMTTLRGTFSYRVTRTQIVAPDNVSVIAPTSDRSLTLVTCYPFVYVGHAPQRFIVSAVIPD